jgi:hypothetical protein
MENMNPQESIEKEQEAIKLPTNHLEQWKEFIAALDEAGYRIVKKPTLLDKGVPNRHAY